VSQDASNRVSQIFLGVFVIALAFLPGTGVGSRTSESIVDGAISEIIDSAPQEIDRVLLERAAIEGALRASGDEWANYFPITALDKLSQLTANSISGAGISITRTRSGALEIANIQSGSPAEQSGIRVDDQILQVDGKNVQGQRATSVAALIRGRIGREVKIVVRRDTEVLSFMLKAEPVEVKTVEVAQVSEEIAYIEISSFAPQTSLELSTALTSLKTASGIVIDLRDNPGGSIESAVQVAEKFIGRGVIVSYRVNGQERVLSASNSKPNTAPIVLLVNRGTSSAAEILAAAFQDRNRGVVIGEKSYGKGSVQDFVTLKDGSKLELTVGLYLTPSGRTIEGVGVTPDLEVPDDELSTKALQILGGLSQLTSPKSDPDTTKK
jgi:carboxyl-terminal processing protease